MEETSKTEVVAAQTTSSSLEIVRAAVSHAITASQTALEEIRKQVSEYDRLNLVAEKAHGFLMSALDAARAKIEELRQHLASIPITEIPAVAIMEALTQANSAFHLISERAKLFDEKYQVNAKVAAAIASAREAASLALEAASTNLEAARDVSRTTTVGGVTSFLSQLVLDAASGVDAKYKISDHAKSLATSAATTAANLDTTYNISQRVVAVAQDVDSRFKVTEMATAVDERFGVTEKAAAAAAAVTSKATDLDERVTGGRVTVAVHKGVEAATAGALYMQSTFVDAKAASAAAEPPAVPEPANLPPAPPAEAEPAPAAVAEAAPAVDAAAESAVKAPKGDTTQ